MNHEETGGVSRRRAMRRAAGLGLGATIVWMSSGAARAQAKIAKDAVKYTDNGNLPGKDCDDCQQYLPPATAGDAAGCRIVEGAISPHGHCIAFTPRAK